MDVRPADLRKGVLLPRYYTLIILAAALAHIRRQEAVGIRYNPESGAEWATDVLKKVAPKTMTAIETMPVIPDDPLQREHLMGM